MTLMLSVFSVADELSPWVVYFAGRLELVISANWVLPALADMNMCFQESTYGVTLRTNPNIPFMY